MPKEEYVQFLNDIIEQTKTEFKNYPLDEQTSKNKQDLVNSKTSFLEELENLGGDNSLILDIKSEYRKAKAILKAKYLDWRFFESVALIVLTPLFIIVMIAICLESKGHSIYNQIRIGKGDR
ncbi:MAG: hypothetical protein R3Y09_04300 [Clostridia bacterium]